MTGHAYDGRVLDAAIDPEQQALVPEVSGNAINGLGEGRVRPPSTIYWQDPRRLAHGRLQNWMLEKTRRDVPQIMDMRNGLGGRGNEKRAPVAPQQVPGDAAGFAAEVKAFALAAEADAVGIARMRPEWIYAEHADSPGADLPNVIIVLVQMDHAELATAPEPPSVVEVMRQYNRGTRVARAVADRIRERGYMAVPHGGPVGGPLVMVPAAIAAGLGELGKHGSIINRRFGSSFRLAAVLTDMPLTVDEPDRFGADDFCRNCQVCSRACPPDAIGDAKQTVRGVEKWYVDFDRCLPYFNQTYGCGICIAVCPWSRPEVGPKLLQKMLRRLGSDQA